MFVNKKTALTVLLLIIFWPGRVTLTAENMGFSQQDENKYIDLPEVSYASSTSVEEALLNRRSVRDFKDEALTLSQVSQLLWAAYGITEERSQPGFLRGGLRTAPSAGALYPLEIYLVAGKVANLDPGLYKYQSDGHRLEFISEGDFRAEVAEAALSQDFLKNVPATIVYTAVYERTTQKYGERGRERYVSAELGHSAQNVCLQAETLGLGTCTVGAFSDKKLANTLMLPDEEEPLYIMPIGEPK